MGRPRRGHRAPRGPTRACVVDPLGAVRRGLEVEDRRVRRGVQLARRRVHRVERRSSSTGDRRVARVATARAVAAARAAPGARPSVRPGSATNESAVANGPPGRIGAGGTSGDGAATPASTTVRWTACTSTRNAVVRSGWCTLIATSRPSARTTSPTQPTEVIQPRAPTTGGTEVGRAPRVHLCGDLVGVVRAEQEPVDDRPAEFAPCLPMVADRVRQRIGDDQAVGSS